MNSERWNEKYCLGRKKEWLPSKSTVPDPSVSISAIISSNSFSVMLSSNARRISRKSLTLMYPFPYKHTHPSTPLCSTLYLPYQECIQLSKYLISIFHHRALPVFSIMVPKLETTTNQHDFGSNFWAIINNTGKAWCVRCGEKSECNTLIVSFMYSFDSIHYRCIMKIPTFKMHLSECCQRAKINSLNANTVFINF